MLDAAGTGARPPSNQAFYGATGYEPPVVLRYEACTSSACQQLEKFNDAATRGGERIKIEGFGFGWFEGRDDAAPSSHLNVTYGIKGTEYAAHGVCGHACVGPAAPSDLASLSPFRSFMNSSHRGDWSGGSEG